MDPAFRTILDEIHRRFDESDARLDRRFAKFLATPEQRRATVDSRVDMAERIPAAQSDVVVVADNWGGLFDRDDVPIAAGPIRTDTLLHAARDAVSLSDGPCITVPLGRHDSRGPPSSIDVLTLPPPSATADELTSAFGATDLVALSVGAHTVGRSACRRPHRRTVRSSPPSPRSRSRYDVLALVTFKTGVSDPSGHLAAWTEDDDRPCSWPGVGCDARTSRVASLSLPAASPSGRLPRALIRLDALLSLALPHNNFSGPVRSCITQTCTAITGSELFFADEDASELLLARLFRLAAPADAEVPASSAPAASTPWRTTTSTTPTPSSSATTSPPSSTTKLEAIAAPPSSVQEHVGDVPTICSMKGLGHASGVLASNKVGHSLEAAITVSITPASASVGVQMVFDKLPCYHGGNVLNRDLPCDSLLWFSGDWASLVVLWSKVQASMALKFFMALRLHRVVSYFAYSGGSIQWSWHFQYVSCKYCECRASILWTHLTITRPSSVPACLMAVECAVVTVIPILSMCYTAYCVFAGECRTGPVTVTVIPPWPPPMQFVRKGVQFQMECTGGMLRPTPWPSFSLDVARGRSCLHAINWACQVWFFPFRGSSVSSSEIMRTIHQGHATWVVLHMCFCR